MRPKKYIFLKKKSKWVPKNAEFYDDLRSVGKIAKKFMSKSKIVNFFWLLLKFFLVFCI